MAHISKLANIMRPFIIIPVLFFFISCQDRDKNFDGTAKNYTPITVDTNCINPWSKAYFELSSKNFDTVTTAIRAKLVSVLGEHIFNEIEFKIMSDSIKKAVFNMDSAFISGDILIDTTNLLRLKDNLNYYMSAEMTPRVNPDWKNLFTQFKQFTYQKTSRFEIGYTITPCIKKIINLKGQFKRERKGKALPDYSKSTNARIDRINIYDCLLNISILIAVDDKSGLLNTKRQFYEVKIIDTAKVFTTIDIMTQK